MTRWRDSVFSLEVLIVGIIIFAPLGCKSSNVLPDVKNFSARAPAIAPDASPVYRWQGSRGGLFTYWGKQQISVDAKAFVPQDCKDARDSRWEASARNGEGKPIPFLGIIRRYTGENGTELTEIIPPVDLDKLADCLYLVIDPSITTDGAAVKSIQPVAMVTEVRNHTFKPFRVKIPLLPQQESPLTPKPVIPEEPAGTPFPAN